MVLSRKPTDKREPVRVSFRHVWYWPLYIFLPHYSTVIVASGASSIALNCTSTPGITGSADDIITTCTDPVSSHSIDGNQTAKQSLPPFSLVTAYPAHGGCTFDSIINPTFYYRGMFFETNAYPENNPDSATLKRFTAGLTGPGFKDFFFYENKAIAGQGVDTK